MVPGSAIEAYALPGWPGRIVVSGRLLDCLDERRRTALIAHEQAHLDSRHHLFATAARLAAAANPLLIPVARAVDYTVERWADEHAAAVTSDRRLVAETIGQVALMAGPGPQRAGGMALGITGRHPRRVSVAWAGPVPRRVAALLTAPPRRQTILLAACTAIVLLAGVAALLAARDLHTLLELAQGRGGLGPGSRPADGITDFTPFRFPPVGWRSWIGPFCPWGHRTPSAPTRCATGGICWPRSATCSPTRARTR